MKEHNYTFLQKFVKQHSGIVLQADKMYLVNSRFGKVLSKYNLENNDQIIERVRFQPLGDIAKDVIDVLTTNETSFYRDMAYYEELKNDLLPKLIESRRRIKSLRIWSAAASSGQEAYTLAMILDAMKYGCLEGWKISIVATDISVSMIEKAKRGVYSQFEVQRGLPINMLLNHFEQIGTEWKIKDNLRSKVEFRIMNLLNPVYDVGMCDLILCKNVLIYFDEETKLKTIDKLKKVLNLDGYLVFGAADIIANKVSGITQVTGKNSVYRLSTQNMDVQSKVIFDNAQNRYGIHAKSI